LGDPGSFFQVAFPICDVSNLTLNQATGILASNSTALTVVMQLYYSECVGGVYGTPTADPNLITQVVFPALDPAGTVRCASDVDVISLSEGTLVAIQVFGTSAGIVTYNYVSAAICDTSP